MPIDIIGKSTTQLSDTNARSKTQQADDTNKPAGRSDNSAPANSTDTVSLTRTATTLQQMERHLESVPVVDLKHVREIRDQLEHGTFKTNPARVAIKLLNLEFGLNLQAA
ncbi:MAG: negative regulator of flagellin synthesis FlgM [Gammaproteobacteria bacterium]|nr:MAG: negative regulator of flagellin synthesis FlgM [Gammaproteobacteria bacterium]TND06692.1 MAG: negative regulator of flagellin synthesis FlgM [Gammaproteobacteria bacterium]